MNPAWGLVVSWPLYGHLQETFYTFRTRYTGYMAKVWQEWPDYGSLEPFVEPLVYSFSGTPINHPWDDNNSPRGQRKELEEGEVLFLQLMKRGPISKSDRWKFCNYEHLNFLNNFFIMVQRGSFSQVTYSGLLACSDNCYSDSLLTVTVFGFKIESP